MKQLVVCFAILLFALGGCSGSDPVRPSEVSPQPGIGDQKALLEPDIAITAFSASSDFVLPGEVLHLTVEVANLGAADATTPFQVGIMAIDSGKMLAKKTLPGLAAGDVVSGTIDFAIPAKDFAGALPPGDYTLACGHDFPDSTTANNRRDIVVTVKGEGPPQECMEIYFSDSGEWLPCQDVPFLGQPELQIVWHNPSMAVVGGFECGWDLAGSSTDYLSIFTVRFPVEAFALDIGLKDPLTGDYNIICGFGSPIPTSKATVLATMDVIFLEQTPNDRIDLTLRNAIPASFPGETRPIVASGDYMDLFAVDVRHISGSPSVQFNPTACAVRYVDEQPVKKVLDLFK